MSLVLQKKEKQKVLEKIKKEIVMISEGELSTATLAEQAALQRKRLNMKLATVNIKINEAERSRRTYELNTTHIKDEMQENHKELDELKRTLFFQDRNVINWVRIVFSSNLNRTLHKGIHSASSSLL